MAGYDKLHEDIKAGRVISAYAAEANGIAEAVSKMAFGNHLGVKIEHNVDPRDFFAAAWGDIVCEVPADQVGNLAITYTVIGEVTGDGVFHYGNTEITMDEGSYMEMESVQIKGVDSTIRTTRARIAARLA